MKAILFDVDDTLYDLSEPFCKAYTELFGQEEEALLQKIFRSSRKYSDEVYNKALAGEITMEEMYIYRVQNALLDYKKQITDKKALEFQSIYEKYQFQIALSKTMSELLLECAKHWTLGVITNGSAKHQWDKVYTLGLTRYIPKEHIFVSGDLGFSKPQKEIFTYACERIGAPVEEACFVGDSIYNDIMGSKNAGLKAVWFHRRQADNLSLNGVLPDWEAKSEEELRHVLMQLKK